MSWLADIVLVVHFAIAAFITAGFVVIPLGVWAGWRFVRARRVRLLHLGAILFVALETLLGFACPLTVWEDRLRATATAGEEGFIARWVRALLYYDIPAWVFAAVYVTAALVALYLWYAVPPEKRRSRRADGQ